MLDNTVLLESLFKMCARTFDRAAWRRNWAKKHPGRIRAFNRKYYKRDAAKRREASRCWYQSNRNRGRLARSIYAHWCRWLLKILVLGTLGGRCECCGEAHWELLTLEHRKGDGTAERTRLKDNTTLYKEVIRQNFPTARYGVLCMSCNWAVGHFGYCPHQR